MYKKKIFICYLLLSLASFSNAVSLKEKPLKKINVLAFWGYLDDPNITKLVESKCNVKLSHDTYYTNEEFLDIFNKRKDDYDVIIFSNLVYGIIKNKIGFYIKQNIFNSMCLWYIFDNNL